MTKSKIFIALSVSFLVGVLLGSVWNFREPQLGVSAAFAIILFALGNKYVRVIILCSITLVLGIVRIGYDRSQENEFTSWFGEKQDLEAIIVEGVDIRSDKQLLTVKPIGSNQRILVTTTKFGQFFYGDRVWLRGKVTEPVAFDDFDYRGYLERHHVYGLMRYPKIITLKTAEGNPVKYTMLRVKARVVGIISERLPNPRSSLLLGILIGEKRALPQDVVENFIDTGTSHIVVASGYNISIIVVSLGFLARLFGRKASFWISLCCIIAFVVMAGAGSSIIRAAVMGVLFLLSFNIGRLYVITPSLCLAAGLMVLVNPRILFWDVGFQLSFAATVGIVYGVPVLQALTSNVEEWFGLKTLVCVTLAATLSTLPILLFNFERLSTVTLLANLLVVPAIPLVMLLGLGVLLPFVSYGFAFVVSFVLQYMLFVTSWFAGLSFADVAFSISTTTFIAMVSALMSMYFLLRIWTRHKQLEAADIRLIG